jgi:hypothetical protein
VYRLAYNGDVVRRSPDQLAVFQGASEGKEVEDENDDEDDWGRKQAGKATRVL